jgi:hypothetical protein
MDRGHTKPQPVQLDLDNMRKPTGFPSGQKMRMENGRAIGICEGYFWASNCPEFEEPLFMS